MTRASWISNDRVRGFTAPVTQHVGQEVAENAKNTLEISYPVNPDKKFWGDKEIEGIHKEIPCVMKNLFTIEGR